MRLIDADELKTAFPTCDNSKSILIASVRATINHMPTIEERKKGKWHSRIYSKIEMFVCSECQHEYSYDAETGERFYNYCPNCGAKMER